MSDKEWDEETRKKIEEISYFKWIDAGKPEGRGEQFWQEAEREVSGDFNVEEELIEINFRRPKKKTSGLTKASGYKSESHTDSGYYYAPYVPLMTTPTVLSPESFNPKKGIMTKYGKKMLEDGAKYYGEIKLNVETDIIEAKTRKLKANWSFEAQQDCSFASDIQRVLSNKLAAELNDEIDREVLKDLRDMGI